jgi:sulfite reductase (NADPH) flavoprotein alpha-component
VVFSFAGDQPQASYVDPVDGRVLGPWQASTLPRWVKNLHRSLLLGDAGRWGAAIIALAMALLCASALVLLLRRMGGWRRLGARVRGTLAQRIHVVTGRVVLVVLGLTSVTALTMSASTLGLVELDARAEPEVLSVANGQPDLPGAQLAVLQRLTVQDLRKLTFPSPADPEDTWKIAAAHGQGWIDRYSGQWLAWQDATLAQRVYDLAVVLHTGAPPGSGPWCSGWRAPASCCSGGRAWSSGGRHAVWRRTSPATLPWPRPTCSSSWQVKAAAPGALRKRCKTH